MSTTGDTRPTIADQLLDRLVAAGVRHLFGVPGDYNLRFLDAVEARSDIEWVGNANELNAAYAADGYARIHGLAAVLTTYGVGELSAINGIAGSYAESVPVLMIVGTPGTQVQANGTLVHHSLLDGDSGHFQRAYDEVTCVSAVVTELGATDEIDRVLAQVQRHKRPGYLALASDLVTKPAPPATRTPPAAPAADLPGFTRRSRELLDGAGRVVVLVDHLADRYRVAGAVHRLIQAGRLPSATVTGGKSVINEDTPGFLGLYIGALSEPAVREAVEGADVVITAGLRLIDLNSGGFTANLPQQRLVDLQPHHAVLGGARFDGVTMSGALHALTPIVAERGTPRSPAIQPPTAPAPITASADAPLTQDVFWRRIGHHLRPGDLLAAEQGTSYYGVLGLRLPPEVDLIAQPMWSSIGYTLPGVIGAQLAAGPGRRALLFIGDGSAEMTVQELGTLARRGMAGTIFLLNNDGYTVERAINGWNADYNNIARWNWDQLPAAFGATGALVTKAGTAAELDIALKACEAAEDQLCFVEVVLDRHDLPRLLAELSKAVATQNS